MGSVCEKCGSSKIVSGNLSVMYSGVVFTPSNAKGLGKAKKTSEVIVDACVNCGCIFNIKLEHPENII